LELPDPRPLRPDEVLIEVRSCGVGNWDEIARTGGWDLGIQPPMALGVEAAGTVAAVGSNVLDIKVGDVVATHSLPLRDQGSWAELLIAAGRDVAVVPPEVSPEIAGALPVPALTALQAIADGLMVTAGQTVLVNGAGGVTGRMLVQLAVHYGATVIATAGKSSTDRLVELGAATVVDYHQPDWPDQVRKLTGGGADGAANAVPAGAREALKAVRDGGRLVTITSDPPTSSRNVTETAVQVVPDGMRLQRLVTLAANGTLSLDTTDGFALEQAAAALAAVEHGTQGAAVTLRPSG